MLWTAMIVAAFGQQRGAIGVGVGGGISPFEPTFTGLPGPAASITFDLEAWALTGGEDRVGRRGRTYRTPDHQRIGLVCAGGFNEGRDLQTVAQHGGCGLGLGGQWGGPVYFTAWTVGGFGAYNLVEVDPSPAAPGGFERFYTSVGPWIRPKVAVGLGPVAGLAFEFGPYASIVVPLGTEFHNGTPYGRYLGQFGFELTTLIGSTTPTDG
ncbi:MAG: hypothetical protein ABMB14_23830 [Myxococcota bacterium]